MRASPGCAMMKPAPMTHHELALPEKLAIGIDTISSADYGLIRTLFPKQNVRRIEKASDLFDVQLAIIDVRRLRQWERALLDSKERLPSILALIPSKYQRVLPYSYLINLADDWVFYPLTQQELYTRILLLYRRSKLLSFLKKKETFRLQLSEKHHRSVAELFADVCYSMIFEPSCNDGCMVDWISDNGIQYVHQLNTSVLHPSAWLMLEDKGVFLEQLDMTSRGQSSSKIMRVANGHWVRHYMAPIKQSKRVVGAICALQDIHHQYQKSLENIKLKTAIQSNTNPVFLIDVPSGDISYANDVARSILRNGRTKHYLGRAALETKEGETRRLIVESQGRIYEFELTHQKCEHFEVRELFHVVLADGVEITDKLQFEAKLQYFATHDPLTELANRKLFISILEDSIKRQPKEALHVVLFDITNLKEINEAQGHDIADEVLITISRKIPQLIPDYRSFARIGGNEFALLMDRIDSTDLSSVLKSIHDKLSEGIFIGEEKIPIVMNFGVVTWPNDGKTSALLLQHAESALRTGREKGFGGIVFFEPKQNQLALNRLHVLANVKHGLAHNEFVLHYQLQIATRQQCPVCAEALLRWQHPTEGLLSPFAFLEIIENSPLIFPLSTYVLEQVCQQIKSWHDDELPISTIAVNLSPRQLLSDDFSDNFINTLERLAIPPHAIEAEVTESMLIEDKQKAQHHLRKLKAFGVRLAIDDFGTGYSSLGLLAELPFDKLKLDKSLVSHVLTIGKARKLAKAIIDLADQLHLATVAEGIENEELAKFFIDAGCQWLQGYWINKPCPADQIKHYLDKNQYATHREIEGDDS